MLKPKLLLIGEGDFSFAAAQAANETHTVVATALLGSTTPTERQLKNIKYIKEHGGLVFLDVDATRLSCHPHISSMKFHRIQFNFPHVGGKMKINANRNMVLKFFQSCRRLLDLGCLNSGDGQVWVSLCAGQGGTPIDTKCRKWHDTWQVVPLAASAEFVLVDVLPFRTQDFPGYTCTGYRSLEKGFTVEGALVHVFQYETAFCCPAQQLPCSLTEDVEIQGVCYEVPCFYAKYLKQRLLVEEGNNPVKKVSDLAEKYLFNLGMFSKSSSAVPVLQQHEDVYFYPAEKLVRIRNKESNTEWTLAPSFISSKNHKRLVSMTECSYRVFQTFLQTKICTSVVPVQNQMWITWQSYSSFNPIAFLQTLLPEMEIYMISSGHSVEEITDNEQFMFLQIQLSRCVDETGYILDSSYVLCREISDDIVTGRCVALVFEIRGTSEPVNHMCITIDIIAMAKYGITDWRILWTEGNFSESGTSAESCVPRQAFRTKSIFPTSYVQDVSFWLPSDDSFKEDSLLLLLRCATGEGLESVSLLEEYVCRESGRKSRCYRLVYKTWKGSLSKEHCNHIHNNIRELLTNRLNVVVR